MENIKDNWKWMILFYLYHFKSNSVSSYKKKAYATNNFDKHICLYCWSLMKSMNLSCKISFHWNGRYFTSQQILIENFRVLEWVPYIYYTQLNKFDMFVSMKLSPKYSEHIHHSRHLSEPCLLPPLCLVPQPSMIYSSLTPESYALLPIIEEYIL